MTNEEMEYWTAKQKALAESLELLAASSRDLRASVEALVERQKARDERQRARDERSGRYLDMLASVFKAWAEDHQQ